MEWSGGKEIEMKITSGKGWYDLLFMKNLSKEKETLKIGSELAITKRGIY